MKLYAVIKKVRGLTKKSETVRNIINFVPILGALDRTAFVYSRVKEEEHKLIGYLSESPRPIINLVCDLRCTPPTYGDFTAFLLAFKILNSKFQTNFFLLSDEFSSEWNVLENGAQGRCVEDFKIMAVQVTGMTYELIDHHYSFEQLLEVLRGGHTVFADYVKKRKKIYWDLKYLNLSLFKSMKCDNSVLLDSKKSYSKMKDLPDSYVAWHIHRGHNFDLPGSLSFEESYDLVRQIIGFNITLITMSTPQKISEVMRIATAKKLNVKSARLFSCDILGDIDLVNGADLFFQIGGGGLAEFALYSEKPFCLVDYSEKRIKRWNSNYFGLKPFQRRFLPWQGPNQIFLKSKNVEAFLVNKLIP